MSTIDSNGLTTGENNHGISNALDQSNRDDESAIRQAVLSELASIRRTVGNISCKAFVHDASSDNDIVTEVRTRLNSNSVEGSNLQELVRSVLSQLLSSHGT